MPLPSLNTSLVCSSFGPTDLLAGFLVLMLLKADIIFMSLDFLFLFFFKQSLLARIMVWPVLCWDFTVLLFPYFGYHFQVLKNMSVPCGPVLYQKNISVCGMLRKIFFLYGLVLFLCVLIYKVAFIYSSVVFKVLLLLRQWGERRWLQISSKQKCVSDPSSSFLFSISFSSHVIKYKIL